MQAQFKSEFFTVFLGKYAKNLRNKRTPMWNESCFHRCKAYFLTSILTSGNFIMKLFQVLTIASILAVSMVHTTHASSISGQGTWQTTLQNRDLNGDGVVDAFYDTQLNVTWLRDANLVGDRTSVPGLPGRPTGGMSWNTATAWAANLNIGGITGWRLPTVNDTGTPGCNFAFSGTDCGFNMDTSTGNAVNNELAHLFYVTLGNLGCVNTAGINVAVCGLTNTANFQNFEQYAYWSGTAYAPSTYEAWYFDTSNDGNFNGGNQTNGSKVGALFAVAVHSGDVGAAAVPLPSTAALLLLAFGAMAVTRRK
jgi:Protein of unknown function (DUF1566)